jgi:zinc protease
MNLFKMLTLLLITVLISTAQAQNPRDLTFPELNFDPAEPVRFETANGIVVYFLEDHDLPVVSANAYFKGGNVYDPLDLAGLTEVTARLMRTGGAGSRSPEEVDEALGFVGASINCNAERDQLSIPFRTLRKDLDITFGVLADLLIRPTFDAAKLALEISNLQDGIRRQNESSWGISRRIFSQTLYGDHPYGWFATLESTGKITRDSVVSQYQKFYTPGNCYVALTGDLTVDEAKRLIKTHLGGWNRSGNQIEPIAMATANYSPGVYYAKKDINQANIRLGHLGLDDNHPDRYAMEVTNLVLGGGGFTSRMVNQIRTTAGLAYSVGTYNGTRLYNGAFFGYCLTRADAMSEALGMMIKIIEEVITGGVTVDEMKLAKESIINSYVFNYDTPSELVSACARLELQGFPRDQLEKTLESYKAVTVADCNRVAREYLDTENLVIVVTGDKDQFDKPLDGFGPTTAVSMEIK